MAGTESRACGVVGQGGFRTSSLPKPALDDEPSGSKVDMARGQEIGVLWAPYIIKHRNFKFLLPHNRQGGIS